MLIVCPSCASRYSIDDDKIGTSGRTVRCANCRTDFFVSLAEERPSAAVAPAPAETVATPDEVNPAPAAAPPPPSADDDLAAKWLAEMERDGTPVSEEDAANPQPQDLDQGSLDELFDTLMVKAQQEADAALQVDAGPQTDITPPATGWRRFLPGGKGKDGNNGAAPAKAGKKLSRSAARGGASHRRTSASGKPSAVARLKGPLGLGLVGLFLIVGAIMQRQTIVRLLPSSAGVFSAIGLPVNLRGLEFADIRSTSQTEGEARFLIVEGGVRSVHGIEVAVPLIEVSLRGEDGRTLYTWTTEPPRKSLKPGEALHFRTRLATPPEAGRNVEVRFTDKLQSARTGS